MEAQERQPTPHRYFAPEESNPCYEVFFTGNYEIFTYLTENREVRKGHVSKLIRDIKVTGFIAPVFVDFDLNVIDGQHRIEAAKILGQEIPYMVIPTPEINTIQRLNSSSKRWSTKDYFHSYANQGLESYQRATALAEEFGVQVAMIPRLTTQYHAQKVRDGDFELPPKEELTIRRTLNLAKGLQRWHKRTLASSFLVALARLIKHPQYDERVFKSNFEAKTLHIPNCNSQGDYYRILVEVMNFRRPKKNHILIGG